MGLLEKMKRKEKGKPSKISKQDLKAIKKPKRKIQISGEKTAKKAEIKAFHKEVHSPKPKPKAKGSDLMPTRVGQFDELIAARGLERGSTILVSGGAGTGKTTFCLQSLYNGALNGERGIYITLEEEPEKLKKHMMKNFQWDFDKLEKEGKIAIIKYDPMEIARKVEASIVSAKEELEIDFEEFELPFKPDRLAVDSLSALSIAFGSDESYRRYIRYLFEKLESYNSVNFVLTETEQNPQKYSRAGIEEFLADGVVVLYNIQMQNNRENAVEILKLRTSKHEKRLVPYKLDSTGMEIYPHQEIFHQD